MDILCRETDNLYRTKKATRPTPPHRSGGSILLGHDFYKYKTIDTYEMGVNYAGN